MLSDANDYAELADDALDDADRLDDAQRHIAANGARARAVVYGLLAIASAVDDVDTTLRRTR